MKKLTKDQILSELEKLKAENEALKAENEKLKAEIKTSSDLIETLEKTIQSFKSRMGDAQIFFNGTHGIFIKFYGEGHENWMITDKEWTGDALKNVDATRKTAGNQIIEAAFHFMDDGRRKEVRRAKHLENINSSYKRNQQKIVEVYEKID